MHTLLVDLARDVDLTGDVARDVLRFLCSHDCPKTAAHSVAVAEQAGHVATLFRVDVAQAHVAGWLHDVSAVFPSATRAHVASQLGIDVLPEEATLPMILHQKLSVALAREIFGVTDTAVLGAIGCHTTLRAGASSLDKIVFVADKIAWDQPGKPPYYDGLLGALNRSLDAAACHYLRYLWDRRATLAVVHPWFVAAYEDLCVDRASGPALGGMPD